MVPVVLNDALCVVLFPEEDVGFLSISELTEWWGRVMVLLLSKVLMVFSKDEVWG